IHLREGFAGEPRSSSSMLSAAPSARRHLQPPADRTLASTLVYDASHTTRLRMPNTVAGTGRPRKEKPPRGCLSAAVAESRVPAARTPTERWAAALAGTGASEVATWRPVPLLFLLALRVAIAVRLAHGADGQVHAALAVDLDDLDLDLVADIHDFLDAPWTSFG